MTAVERLVVRLIADASQYHRIFNTAETRLLTFASIATAVTVEAGRRAIDLASSYEQASVAFKVLTGSAETGKKMLSDIDKFAIATPFTTEDLRNQAQTMAGFGVEVENILPSLKALGDITAGVGGGTERLNRIMYNFSQVMAQGRPYWIDIKQFAMAGINMKEFAETAGVSTSQFREMVEAGQIGSDVIIRTFNRMTQSGGKFNNMMGEMSKTATGQWRSTRELFDLFLRDIGTQALEALKESGIFDGIQAAIQNLKDNGPQIKAILVDAFTNAKTVVLAIQQLWVEIGISIREIEGFFDRYQNVFSSTQNDDGVKAMQEMNRQAMQTQSTFDQIIQAIVMVPAMLSDAMNFLRLGMFTILKGITYVLKEFDSWIVRNRKLLILAGGPHGAGIALSGGTGAILGPDFFKELDKSMLEGMWESYNAMNATEKAMERWIKRTGEATTAGRGLGSILKEVGLIKIPFSPYTTEALKSIEGAKKAFKENDVLGTFSREFNAIETARRFREIMGHGDTTLPGLTGAEGDLAAFRAFQKLEQGVGKFSEPKLPTAMLAGSAEAQDTINKANLKQETAMERVLSVLELQREIQKQTADEAKLIREALEQARKLGIIKRGI